MAQPLELFPHELAADIFRKIPERVSSLNYLGPLGLPELRKVICGRMKDEHGIDANPDNVLITSGSLQALQLISLCMLKKGSDVYTEAPSYLKSLQVFQSAGMNMHGVSMDEEGMRFASLRDADMANSIIYSIPTFHNPTGSVMGRERREKLLNFCRQKRIPLIEDDAYGALWLDEKPPAPIKAMDSGGNVLYLGTISKTMAPGLRIGWVIGPEPVVYRLGDVKMQTDYGSSSVSQWVMTELLTDHKYDDYLTGLYIWMRFHKRLPMDKIFHEMLTRGVLINPGNVYDYTENNAVRLSYAYASPKEFDHAVKLLAEVVSKYDILR